jgi:hypothetical protein
MKLGPGEVQRNAIVSRMAALKLTFTDELLISGSALGFAVVMRTVAAGEESETPERSETSGN